MGWFGRNRLADEVFDLEVEKTYGKWDFRLKNYPGAVTVCFILIVAILVFVGISKNHDKNLSWNKIKAGDVVYPPDNFFSDTADQEIMFSRMIRPMTIADIDTMRISLAEKRKLAAQLDTSKKQTIMLERANWVIPRDSMFKYGVAAIGEFIAKDSITPNDESGVGYDWYAVKPNRKLMYDKYVLRIPNGYVIANDLFFVEPSEVRLEEPSAIKKFRPTTNKNINPPNIKKMDSTSIKNAVVAKPSTPLKTKRHHRKKA